MNTWWTRIKAFHEGLEPERRRTLYALLALTALIVGGVGWWSSQTSWQTVVSGRSYEDLLDAAAALDNGGVPYKLDGSELRVPVAYIGGARSALAGAEQVPGLGDVGALGIGLTPAAQSWAFMRSREGDITRMVNGISGVASSQVSIVPERESLFGDEDTRARASVFVRMRPGRSLDSTQVRAIVNLAVHAVDGLAESTVSVVDDRGNVLHSGDSSSGSAATASNRLLELKQQLEADHERSVSQALMPILGDLSAMSVTATVDLDLATTEVYARTVDAEAPAVTNEALQESSSGAAGGKAGVPGVAANLPERGGMAALAGGAAGAQRSETATSYTYPTSTEHRKVPAGQLRRLSVAVQVDAAKVAELAELAGVEAEALQARLEDTVRAAVGFDARRNDIVAVSVVPFAERTWTEATPAAAPIDPATVEQVAPWALAALTVVLSFVMVVRPLMARLDPPAPIEVEVAQADEPDPDADLADRLQEMVASFQPVDASDLNRLANRESIAAARVLRDWKEPAGGAA